MSSAHVRSVGERIVATTLPEVETWQLRLTAATRQRVPALATTALHGALDDALRIVGCGEGNGAGCRDGCLRLSKQRDKLSEATGQPTCAYLALCRPPGAENLGEGVQDRAPAPVVVAPERYAERDRWIELASGESLAVRISLIGAYACGQGPLVLSALRRVAQTGLGIDPANPQGPRPSLTVERPLRVFEPDPVITSDVRLEFRTPVRLVHEGQVRRHVDAAVLWRAMVRRADTLARCYGEGPLLIDDAPPFEVIDPNTRVVSVTRWSNRQKSRMTWPGVVGTLQLRGDRLREIAPLLGFIQRVQFGKGTSFGFGRIAFSPADEKR